MSLVKNAKSYASIRSAEKKLEKEMGPAWTCARYVIAVQQGISISGGVRYVPVLVGAQYIQYAHVGIMVVS